MSSPTSIGSETGVEEILKVILDQQSSIMKRLDAIEEKLQPIQPLEERVAALEAIIQNFGSLPQATVNQVESPPHNQGGFARTVAEPIAMTTVTRGIPHRVTKERQVYNNCIIRYLEDPPDSVPLPRDGNILAAYRLPKNYEKSSLVVFTHQHFDEHSSVDNMTPQMKEFGAPLLAVLPEKVNGLTLKSIYLKLLNPFRFSKGVSSLNDSVRCNGGCAVNLMNATPDSDGKFQSAPSEDVSECRHCGINECQASEGLSVSYTGGTADSDCQAQMEQFEFYLTNGRGGVQQMRIEMNELDLLETTPNRLYVSVYWQQSALRQYGTSMLSCLPEIHKLELVPKGTEDYVALHGCLEAFLKEEPLGPEDMWYCPCCKKHQQAMKKLDLWRLPEVLIIHLKRFSYTQFIRNKLETFVDFPICDLDLSSFVTEKNELSICHYRLYAISNHYGNMGGGHYTSSIYHEEGKRWYKFDDECVTPITEDSIKTPAAYVLFYRRE
ncbi:hypothetical protein GUJ93_ZPchr0016g2636 [Zizania palustris]|uniref:USP domain-containing protein n=1 Tax=Zizania palustris TaxID=103762 RepID=A0A8J5THM2_ZIZPA|nr:hypothetical protein GUJ93_ZPchr0016g2636 [Zizania palustris]